MWKMQEQFSTKQVSKEKTTRMPLASCAPVLLLGVAKRVILVPLAKRGFPARTYRAIPNKITGARRGIREYCYLRNKS
jgi:hypothetical protein